MLRRRWHAIEPVLRLELALIALLVGGFLFLQVRGALEAHAWPRGDGAMLGALLSILAVLAVVGTWLTARRHVRRLLRPEGPAWLALPVEPDELERHLAWTSSAQVGWVALPALVVLLAAIGLVPGLMLVSLGVFAAALLRGAVIAGCALARRRVRGSVAVGSDAPARPRLPAARFGHGAAWRAIARKDALAVARRPELRQGAVGVALFGALSLVGWLLPTATTAPGAAAAPALATAFDLRHLATFFVTLLAAGALAEWMVLLVGADPFATLRVLPLDVRTVWRARAVWAVAFTVVLVSGHAVLAHGLALGPRILFLAWVAATTLAIAILGLNFALTLYPRTGPARPLLGLTFGVMAIASVAVFLSGWLVLVVALIATARRLPRWERSTEGEP